MTERSDLKLNQEKCTQEVFRENVSEDQKGLLYQEGFTAFSIKDGFVLLNGRKLNSIEQKRGTICPKVSKEEVEKMKILATDFMQYNCLADKEIFLLVSNKESCYIDNMYKITILGYYQGNIFIFAVTDKILNNIFKELVTPFGNARDIFNKHGKVVYPNPEGGQPITVLDVESNYYTVSKKIHHLKEELAPLIIKNGEGRVTDRQAFLYFYGGNPEEAEDLLSKISSEGKREELNKIKENFLFFNNYLGDINIVSPDSPLKLYLNYQSALDTEHRNKLEKNIDLPKTWRIIFGQVRKQVKDLERQNKPFQPNIFREMIQTTMIVPISKLCVRYDSTIYSLKIVE